MFVVLLGCERAEGVLHEQLTKPGWGYSKKDEKTSDWLFSGQDWGDFHVWSGADEEECVGVCEPAAGFEVAMDGDGFEWSVEGIEVCQCRAIDDVEVDDFLLFVEDLAYFHFFF